MSEQFQPTEEQLNAEREFATGESLGVIAFAGSGKTTSLVRLGQARRTRGAYIAFNRAIADEAAAKFTRNVACRTWHSLAWRHVAGAHNLDAGKMSGSVGPVQLADLARIPGGSYAHGFRLNAVQRSYLVLKTIQAFCHSADPRIDESHMPTTGRLTALSPVIMKGVRSDVTDLSRNIWAQMTSPQSKLPLGHDGYLKLFALSDPLIKVDFLLVDEAQDTNPVALGILNRQNCQIVACGDPYQSIYTWRGAVDALTRLKTPRVSYLTQSFRFGPEIASLASGILRTLGEDRPLRGNPRMPSLLAPVQERHTVLCRTNASVMAETLTAMQCGKKVWIVGGAADAKRLLADVKLLKNSRHAQSPELFGFPDWDSVIEFSEDDEGVDLRPLVQLVSEFGEDALMSALDRVEKEEWTADIVVGTAHKSKGREFNAVRIASDFEPGDGSDDELEIDDEESRLFYVAVTRAQRVLQVDPAIVRAYLAKPRKPPEPALERSRLYG